MYENRMANMDLGLQNKTAVVTGASRGIGKAIALALGREGVAVVVNYLQSEMEAQQVVQDVKALGSEAIAVQADVASPLEVEDLLQQSLNKFGRVHLLVNNAGVILRPSGWKNLTEQDWQRMVDINLKGVFNCIRTFASHMLQEKEGKIVNIASAYGIIGSAPVIAYSAAKGGVISITKSFAKELAPYITVNAVAPGTIDTSMTRSSGQDFVNSVIAATPLKRLGKPEEVANAVTFLLSSKADFITGHVLVIDGGYMLK